jgi:acetyl-CoA C-acetyltransferase
MSLFGGPGNNYSLHAIAELAGILRQTEEGAGLVSANGGYLTKHAVGVYARQPGVAPWTPCDDAALQASLDARPTVKLVERGEGAATVEAHTVRYSGEHPESGIVILRLPDRSRCVAVVDAGEEATLARLLAEDCVGLQGAVEHRDGINHFRFQD